MKDMIYYPGFETRDENWLKFALLYFDTLRPIIPYTIYSEKRYLSDTFQYVMGETDLIKPYRPEYEVVLCQEKVQVKSELFLQHSIFSSSQSFYFIQFLFIHILIFVW